MNYTYIVKKFSIPNILREVHQRDIISLKYLLFLRNSHKVKTTTLYANKTFTTYHIMLIFYKYFIVSSLIFTIKDFFDDIRTDSSAKDYSFGPTAIKYKKILNEEWTKELD